VIDHHIKEVVLPRRAVPQPTPNVYPHGDCGACVLAGVFGLTVEETYQRFQGKVDTFNYYERRNAIRQAVWEGLAEHCIDEFPEWPLNRIELQQEFGLTAWHQGGSYWNYLRMAFAGGYYGIAEVNYEKQGPEQPSNHVVLLCGAREHRPESRTIQDQLLVSCSARSSPDEEWVEVHEFLKRRGGFNVLLVKPG
jgi:hypothetical protein